MTHYYLCTLFDKNFLARGLALYDSLIEWCPNFTLWILCMDEESYEILQRLELRNVKLLRLSQVEDDNLLAVRSTRTPVEYCWMFSSSLPLFLLKQNPNIEMITYLDADMYFYTSPDEIYREFKNNSIMIIPHRFSKKNIYRKKMSGIYNVGMMIFRNDEQGIICLEWWKDRCIEWCYNRYEDGKLGDQLYLNDWPTRFRNVCILENLGADVAPWNIDSYIFRLYNNMIIGTDNSSKKIFPLIFYHFHGLNIYLNKCGGIKAYPITVYEKHIYNIYLKALQKAYDKIRHIEKQWDYGCTEQLNIFRRLKQKISKHMINLSNGKK